MSCRFTTLILMVLLSISAFAQTKNEVTAPQSSGPTQNCFATFNDQLPNFCVTQNGNVENFFFPAGFSQIHADGYGMCDSTGGNTNYYDNGDSDSGNWLDPVISEPHGPNTLPLTITRTTSDGVWTLKQVFTRNVVEALVKVTMTWTNRTAVDRQVYFTRYVDIDADGNVNNLFGGTTSSGFGYGSSGTGVHGLLVRAGQSDGNFSGFVVEVADDLIGNKIPCVFQPTAPFFGNQAIMYLWIPGGSNRFFLPAHKSATHTLEFRPM